MTGPDVVIVGGGHNGLVAAAYLARAGRRVQVLERLDHVGGAAVSAHAFDGIDARLSRYSYLVSLLPRRIVDDLGARVRLVRRRYSSYTPDPSTGGPHGPADRAAVDVRSRWSCGRRGGLRRVLPSLPRRHLPALADVDRSRWAPREQARRHVDDDDAWRFMVDEPIGHAITAAVSNDLVRGVMATDALIGTFARADDPTLTQNVCFLYHLLGGGTGDWDVPVGGMGAVSGALAAAAAGHGAEIVTGAEVYAIDPDGEVRYRRDGQEHRVHADFVLANVTPVVLAAAVG